MIEIRTGPNLERGGVKVGPELITVVGAETLVAVNLSGRRLDWANLQGLDLRQADFSKASLAAANLSHTDLSGATFCGAGLMMTNLQGALLADADLSDAKLIGARLQGADLRSARIAGTQFIYAKYDETTQWPEGFDPQAARALLPSQVREWRV